MTDDLLVRYLLNQADAKERQVVRQWCVELEENHQHFERLRLTWESSLELGYTGTVNEHEAWSRFKNGLPEREATPAISIKKPMAIWIKIAAAVIIGVLMTGSFYLLRHTAYSTGNIALTKSDNKAVTDSLPDGSIVRLNKRSSISYTTKLNGNNREINMMGEAFFTVSPDKKRPFIIHVNDVLVKVVGTSFNIKNSGKNTEIIVETGVVEVTQNGITTKLLPKERLQLSGTGKPIRNLSEDKLYNYYYTHEFVCDRTPLPRVVQTLSEAYNIPIIIDNKKLGHLELSTTFSDESLDEILAVICRTFTLQQHKKNGQIILY